MKSQSELWVILQDDELNHVWDMVDSQFSFNPSMNTGAPPFIFEMPVDSYDISQSPIYCGDETTKGIIKSVFIQCMDNDDFMYALDWQHTCFRYNPRISVKIEYPVFVPDESLPLSMRHLPFGGYNVYFPEFYPNGDYYFFIAKDFRWGYLTHPWLKKAWVYGDNLMLLFKKHAVKLGFIQCNDDWSN